MLCTLRIRNLVLVDELELELSGGLNVLTGETGAGKSVLLKGLQLLSGARANADVIRRDADSCLIEAVFVLSAELVERLGAEAPGLAELVDDGEIILRRIVERSGRSKLTANGHLLSKGEAEHLSGYLFDITGQHQNQSLLDSEEHEALLDRFGTPAELLDAVRASYQIFSQHRRRLEEFRKENHSKQEYFRRLGFERDELKAAQLRAGEKEQLEIELRRLSQSEFLLRTVQDLSDAFDAEPQGVLHGVSKLRHVIDAATRKDPGMQSIHELVSSAHIQLDEARRALDDYGETLELDPDKMESMRERFSEIARLERKYAKPIDELIRYYDAIAAEVAEWESGTFDIESLEKSVRESEQSLRVVERELTQVRTKNAALLSINVVRELAELGMNKAQFVVNLLPGTSSETGSDTVEFLFSANPGSDPKPLEKVASGGELSRVLLILKTLLNEQKPSLLQVFDEIDSGVGGATAQIVGEKIKALTPRYQVLIVTHAPQVAAFAERHFVISKTTEQDVTVTRVVALEEEARVNEIARMLAGKTVTANFEQSARELVALASKPPPSAVVDSDQVKRSSKSRLRKPLDA